MTGKYDDMLHMPHHVSSTHPQMSRQDRAAQFSPFAALTGYEAAIQEAGRLTTKRIELDETARAELNGRLQILAHLLPQSPEATVTYFQPDIKKAGGTYQTHTGTVQKIDMYTKQLCFEDGQKIPLAEIFDVTGDWARDIE